MTQFRPSRFEILPVVIKNLLIINVLFFLAQYTVGSTMLNFDNLLALHHVKSPYFQPWQLVTHLFLHGGFWHLFGNMFALWMFGAVLENLWGPKRFLTFYFLCGLGAALLHLGFLWYDYSDLLNQYAQVKANPETDNLLYFLKWYEVEYPALFYHNDGQQVMNLLRNNPENGVVTTESLNYITRLTRFKIDTPTMGASGAVFGVLAAFVYLFPNTDIYLYFLFPIKAKWLGLAYFGYELYSAIQNSAGDNVARWAHIGGGIVGFLLVLTWNKKNRRNFF